jgi:hypothetical protein
MARAPGSPTSRTPSSGRFARLHWLNIKSGLRMKFFFSCEFLCSLHFVRQVNLYGLWTGSAQNWRPRLCYTWKSESPFSRSISVARLYWGKFEIVSLWSVAGIVKHKSKVESKLEETGKNVAPNSSILCAGLNFHILFLTLSSWSWCPVQFTFPSSLFFTSSIHPSDWVCVFLWRLCI